jgi:plasmid stabilization system protein ParE
MRRILYALTFEAELGRLLEQGAPRFGRDVVVAKGRLVLETVATILRDHPRVGRLERRLNLYRYGVTDTPFVLLYDFSDVEIRIHKIVHARSNIPNTDLSTVKWPT